MSVKTCTNKDCAQPNPQPLKNFHGYKRNKDGLSGRCRACVALTKKVWINNNKEVVSRIMKRYRSKAAPKEKRREQVEIKCPTAHKIIWGDSK
jgi:hypothetical protein